MVDRRDEEVSRHSNSNHNDNDDDKSNEDKGWIPRHKGNPVIDPAKIYSVSEASRLHKGKSITVKGVISGIQPMRKMIKGLSRRCMNCNTVYERKHTTSRHFSKVSYRLSTLANALSVIQKTISEYQNMKMSMRSSSS